MRVFLVSVFPLAFWVLLEFRVAWHVLVGFTVFCGTWGCCLLCSGRLDVLGVLSAGWVNWSL